MAERFPFSCFAFSYFIFSDLSCSSVAYPLSKSPQEMSSSLTAETEKDVLPWLQLAEDLRLLKLDCEVSCLNHDVI